VLAGLYGREFPFGEEVVGNPHQKLPGLVQHSGSMIVAPRGIRYLTNQDGRLATLLKNVGREDKAFSHGRIHLYRVVGDVKYHGKAFSFSQDKRDIVVVAEADRHD